MKYGEDLAEYLRSKQRGKAANSLEREALSDPFLYEALEGLGEAKEDPLKVIENLSKRVEYRVYPRKKRIIRLSAGIAAILLVFITLGLFFWEKEPREKVMLTQYAAVEKRDTVNILHLARRDRKQDLKTEAVEDAVVQTLSDSSEADLPEKDTAKPNAELKFRKQLARVGGVKEKGGVRVENKGKIGPMPVGGIEAFERYVQDSLIYPEDAKRAGLEGEIKLSFVVNRYGRPSGIRVVQWITNSCNHEAIRLLENGPRWTYTGTTDSTILFIPFYFDSIPQR